MPVEFSATVDNSKFNFQRLVGVPQLAGSLPLGWSKAVFDGVWMIEMSFFNLKAGEHVLQFAANSPEV